VWRRAAWAALMGVGVFLSLGAARENGDAWVAARVIRCAKTSLFLWKYEGDAEFVSKADVSVDAKNHFASFDLSDLIGWYFQNEKIARFTSTQHNRWVSDYSIIPTIIRLFRQISSPIKEMDSGRGGAFSPVGEYQIYLHMVGLLGRDHIGSVQHHGRSFALDKRPRLKGANDYERARESAQPPRITNDAIWMAESLSSKPTQRFFLIVFIFLVGLTSLVVLFQPHAPSPVAAIAFILFWAAPVVLFLGLVWLG
jgi:hypothetical protein